MCESVKKKKHPNGSQLCFVQPLCNYWINEQCIHHPRLWRIERGTNCTWRKRFMHLLLSWRWCEFGRQRWGKMQLRVLCYLSGTHNGFNTHILLMLAHEQTIYYTFIYNPVILTILSYSEEAVTLPDSELLAFKEVKSHAPSVCQQSGNWQGADRPMWLHPQRAPVCLHVQMYCLSHGHTCV